MPPRKSNISQISAAGEDGTPVKEREGINIEVCLNAPTTVLFSSNRSVRVNHTEWPGRGTPYALHPSLSSDPLVYSTGHDD